MLIKREEVPYGLNASTTSVILDGLQQTARRILDSSNMGAIYLFPAFFKSSFVTLETFSSSSLWIEIIVVTNIVLLAVNCKPTPSVVGTTLYIFMSALSFGWIFSCFFVKKTTMFAVWCEQAHSDWQSTNAFLYVIGKSNIHQQSFFIFLYTL